MWWLGLLAGILQRWAGSLANDDNLIPAPTMPPKRTLSDPLYPSPAPPPTFSNNPTIPDPITNPTITNPTNNTQLLGIYMTHITTIIFYKAKSTQNDISSTRHIWMTTKTPSGLVSIHTNNPKLSRFHITCSPNILLCPHYHNNLPSQQPQQNKQTIHSPFYTPTLSSKPPPHLYSSRNPDHIDWDNGGITEVMGKPHHLLLFVTNFPLNMIGINLPHIHIHAVFQHLSSSIDSNRS